MHGTICAINDIYDDTEGGENEETTGIIETEFSFKPDRENPRDIFTISINPDGETYRMTLEDAIRLNTAFGIAIEQAQGFQHVPEKK